MTTIKEVLENVKVLEGWVDIKVLPEIEEKFEDILFVVEYRRYGDEYLIIGTRDGRVYEYGCYANLKFDFYDYLRKPVLHLTEVEGHVEKNGFAGKTEITRSEWVIADEIVFAYANGEKLDPDEVLKYWRTDDWCVEQYTISLDILRSRARA